MQTILPRVHSLAMADFTRFADIVEYYGLTTLSATDTFDNDTATKQTLATMSMATPPSTPTWLGCSLSTTSCARSGTRLVTFVARTACGPPRHLSMTPGVQRHRPSNPGGHPPTAPTHAQTPAASVASTVNRRGQRRRLPVVEWTGGRRHPGQLPHRHDLLRRVSHHCHWLVTDLGTYSRTPTNAYTPPRGEPDTHARYLSMGRPATPPATFAQN